MNIFFPFLTLTAGNVTAHAGLLNGASNQHVVSHLPDVLPQKRTPWCYAFAARSVFSQALCAKTGYCFGADQLAVTSFIEAFHSAMEQWLKQSRSDFGGKIFDSWWTGGDSGLALQYLSDTRAPIVSRACTHEEKIFQAGDLTPFSLSFFLNAVIEKFYSERARTHENARQYLARVVTDPKILPLVEWMKPAMDATHDFESFSKRALLPPICRGHAALGRTPTFKVKMAKLWDLAAIDKQIETVVDQDGMVGLSICAGTLDSTLGECGYHATAVAGYRTYCQNGACEKQYLFYDSSFFLEKGRNPDGSYWAPAALIAQASLDFLKDADGSSKDGRNKILDNLRQSLTDKVMQRAKILQDYQTQRANILKNFDAGMEALIAKADSDPSLNAKRKAALESQLRNQAVAGRAAFERQMPVAPDMKELDDVIKHLEYMVQNLGNSTPFFNDNNLFWIEFPG